MRLFSRGQGPAPGMGTRVRFPRLGDPGGLSVTATEVPQRHVAQVAALGRALWARPARALWVRAGARHRAPLARTAKHHFKGARTARCDCCGVSGPSGVVTSGHRTPVTCPDLKGPGSRKPLSSLLLSLFWYFGSDAQFFKCPFYFKNQGFSGMFEYPRFFQMSRTSNMKMTFEHQI